MRAKRNPWHAAASAVLGGRNKLDGRLGPRVKWGALPVTMWLVEVADSVLAQPLT